jgi:hypothetical protein
MRTTLLIAACLFVLQTVFAQSFEINFEGSLYNSSEGSLFDIEIDSTDTTNIWQIGTPNKTMFDSAYSAPKAIITDTIDFYPTNRQSSFTLGYNLQGGSPTIDFMHKFDTDSGFDGGYVECSFDEGVSWIHLTAQTSIGWDEEWGVSTSNFYNETDTLQNGKAAFTGLSTEWRQSQISFECHAAKTSFDFYLRFTFSSDSIHSDKEGWMIDNMVVQNQGYCSGIDETESKSSRMKISPNPFQSHTTIEVVNGDWIENGKFLVFDVFGRTVSVLDNLKGNRFLFTNSNLQPGLYTYQLTDQNEVIGTGKFVVN